MQAAKAGRDDADLLHAAVRSAGKLAVDHFNADTRAWHKPDGSPVSQADIDVSAHLRSALLAERADYGWLSEEDTDDHLRLDREYVWIVDPIDGTSSFLSRGDKWSIAVALLHRGRPVLASVYRPLRNQHFEAVAGRGATLNARRIAVSHRQTLPGAKVIAHKNTLKPHRWSKAWPKIEHGMATSLALRLCLVACGEFDAAIAIGKKHEWDLAAGDLIVAEAGGHVSNLAGKPLVYNQPQPLQEGLVASNGALYNNIITHTQTFKG